MPTRDAAMPVLQALAQQTGETAHLSLLIADILRPLAHAYSAAHATKVMLEDTETLPFHATSSGLAVLAFQHEAFRITAREEDVRPRHGRADVEPLHDAVVDGHDAAAEEAPQHDVVVLEVILQCLAQARRRWRRGGGISPRQQVVVDGLAVLLSRAAPFPEVKPLETAADWHALLPKAGAVVVEDGCDPGPPPGEFTYFETQRAPHRAWKHFQRVAGTVVP